MWDQHMHCMFSGDSDADPVLMIKSAINKGLDGICFTDHLDYDYKEEPAHYLIMQRTIHMLTATMTHVQLLPEVNLPCTR